MIILCMAAIAFLVIALYRDATRNAEEDQRYARRMQRLMAANRQLRKVNRQLSEQIGDLEDRNAFLWRRLAAEEIGYIDTLPCHHAGTIEITQN